MTPSKRTPALAAALAALGLATLAVAAGPRPADASRGPGTRPSAQGKEGARPEEDPQVGPPRPIARYRELPKLGDQKREALADRKRDEAIAGLERLLQKMSDKSPQKVDLLYQMSELYWEKSKYLVRKEELAYQAAVEKADAARAQGRKLPAPKRDNHESESYRRTTMKIYERIVRDYPKYERMDEVLFSLALNLDEIGKRDEAAKRYQALIDHHPKSRFLPDAHVELGNYYFDEGGSKLALAQRVAKARHHYERALASKIPKIYSFALYKLAWCDYNSTEPGHHEASLKKLKQVVDFAETRGGEMVDLKNEALSDMVRVYVALDRPDEALQYFHARAAPERQSKLLARLAEGLAEAGHHRSAIGVYQKLIAASPLAPGAPIYQQAIVRSHDALREREKVRTEITRLAEQYRPTSPWWTANEKDAAVLKDAFDASEEAMRQVVNDYHQEAMRTKDARTYRLARDIYKQYLDAFASSPDERYVADSAFNQRFYYAEILWALEEWEKAALAYEAVIDAKIPAREEAKKVSNPEYRQTAAYNAILAYDKLVKIERGELTSGALADGQRVEEKRRKGEVEKAGRLEKRSAKELEQGPLSPTEQKLVAACDRYVQRFPKGKDEIDVRYQAAIVFYEKNHFVESAQRFGEIILRWPEERRSQEAADLSLYVLETKEEWLELNRLARQFLGNKRLAKPGSEFSRRIASVVEGSQYKYVDEVLYKKNKDPLNAADEFLKFVAEFPKSRTADRALTYAAILYGEAGQPERGVQVAERALKEHGRTALRPKLLYTVARFYEQTADFQRAAEKYEQFIAAYDLAAKDKKAAAGSEEHRALLKEAAGWVPDAQFNAALWWEALGKSDRALAAYKQYLTRFKERKDVPEILFNTGLLHERDKRIGEALKVFDAFNAQYAKDPRTTPVQHLLARYEKLKLHLAAKNAKQALLAAQELVRGHGRLSTKDRQDARVLDAYAHARFVALEPLWADFTALQFKRLPTLRKDLAAKLKKVKEVEKGYAEVLAVGAGEQGIAALTRLGLAYADFAQAFLDSPDPKGLDEEQLAMYRAELENRALPLEEKAIEAFEKAIAKSQELGLYGEWSLLAQERLNKYRPGTFGKPREIPFRGGDRLAVVALDRSPPPEPVQPGPEAPTNDEAPQVPAPAAESPEGGEEGAGR